MSANTQKRIVVLGLAACLAAFGAGCGSSNPPCETDLAAVDAARSKAKAAETTLTDAKRQKQDLESQLAAETRRQEELKQRKAELEREIAELQGK